jgi:hypothetical protein
VEVHLRLTVMDDRDLDAIHPNHWKHGHFLSRIVGSQNSSASLLSFCGTSSDPESMQVTCGQRKTKSDHFWAFTTFNGGMTRAGGTAAVRTSESEARELRRWRRNFLRTRAPRWLLANAAVTRGDSA